jgi:ADP-ribose pyrophosphatase YjhB (NUDIX family)
VIVVNDQGGILMIRRTDNGNWAVPGGGMDPGESITDAAVRETREETGISCAITGLVGIYTNPRHVILYTSNGEVRQEFSIVFTARPTGGQLRPSSESSEPQWGLPRSDIGLADASIDAPAHPALPRQTTRTLPGLSSQQFLNTPSSGQDLRSAPLHEPRHRMLGTIPATDLNEPVRRPHKVTIRPSRHIAVQQRLRQRRVARRELRSQLAT